MNRIEIGSNCVLQHAGNIEEPVIIHLYTNSKYREGCFPVKEIRMAIQIFHTDLKHFDLRKAVLIDPDERRPVYGFTFDSPEKQVAFFLKRAKYMMASQQTELFDDDGELVVGAVRNMGCSLYRLRSFQSWMEHLSGRSCEGTYTKDCEVMEVDGGSILHVPDMTIDGLIACLKGEKTLAKAERNPTEPITKTTVDGVELTADKFIKHMIQKAALERMPMSMAN